MYDRADPARCKATDHASWMNAGKVFDGGTLPGIESKLDYLKNLGVTTLWIGPVWKQRADLPDSYHGYGIQNFLEVDPRFGTRQDLRNLVDSAHARGMYVLLDVIYNHTGNNFFYEQDGKPVDTLPYRAEGAWPIKGWRNHDGKCADKIEHPDDGVWPVEFQNFEWYTRAGHIEHWDDPGKELSAQAEFRRGDFFVLKDLDVDKSETLDALVRCYQYWIALSDCDGFRIDTVKHIPLAVSAIFCHEMRTFARRLGKKNFLLLGEVTGSTEMVRNYVDPAGPNLDSILDIESAPDRLEKFVKGLAPPDEFFSHFGGRDALGDVRTIGRHHVSILDDHDMVWRANKHRFAWANGAKDPFAQTAAAVGVQFTTPGIPCIYYGTEQCFTGSDELHDAKIEPCDCGIPCPDRYVRESMFGGKFGAFGTAGCHFFDPSHPCYKEIAALAQIRQRDDAIGQCLRRGEIFTRETRETGPDFHGPQQGEIVAWSRIHENTAVIVALNTHGTDARASDITVDADLHKPGTEIRIVYSNDEKQQESLPIQSAPDGRAFVHIELPPSGIAIMA